MLLGLQKTHNKSAGTDTACSDRMIPLCSKIPMHVTEERVEKTVITSRDGAKGPHKYLSTQLFQTSFLSKKLIVAS